MYRIIHFDKKGKEQEDEAQTEEAAFAAARGHSMASAGNVWIFKGQQLIGRYVDGKQIPLTAVVRKIE